MHFTSKFVIYFFVLKEKSNNPDSYRDVLNGLFRNFLTLPMPAGRRHFFEAAYHNCSTPFKNPEGMLLL